MSWLSPEAGKAREALLKALSKADSLDKLKEDIRALQVHEAANRAAGKFAAQVLSFFEYRNAKGLEDALLRERLQRALTTLAEAGDAEASKLLEALNK